MQLTPELAEQDATRGKSSPYTAGGSTGYESGVAIVPGVTTPDTPIVYSPNPSQPIAPAPLALPVFDPAQYLPDLGAPSPCATCKYNGSSGSTLPPGAVSSGGGYISPPGTGMVTDNFVPALPKEAPDIPDLLDAEAGGEMSWLWWVVGLVVAYKLATTKAFRPK
jgi:hypothetical protein